MDMLNFLIDALRTLYEGVRRLLGISKQNESPRKTENPLDGFSSAIGFAIFTVVAVVMLYYFVSSLFAR